MDRVSRTSEIDAIYELVIAVTRLATAIEAVSVAVAASHLSHVTADPDDRARSNKAVIDQLDTARRETTETIKAMRLLVEGLSDGLL